MRTLILAALVAAALSPSSSRAQVAVDVRIGFPTPPPLVVVQPGIQVVPDYDEEVFFTNGWYWLRRDDGWYRTRDHRGGWVLVPQRVVPVALYRTPPGHYRHWQKEQEKADRKYWKEQEKADRKAWKEHEKRGRKHHHDEDDDD